MTARMQAHSDSLDISMIEHYSEDFKSFAEIVGVNEAFSFARKYGVIQITFHKVGDNPKKHTDKVAEFFGEEVLIKLCEAFGGFGRITIPKCYMLQSQLNALAIIGKLETQGMTENEAAIAYGMTKRNVLYIKANGEDYYKKRVKLNNG